MCPPTVPEGTAAPDRSRESAVESRTAGNRIIRGGALRGSGYFVGTGATALAFALLLRHLGVVDFGRFSAVIALVTVAGGLAEAGLQVTGTRLYSVSDDEGRRRLLRNIMGIRLLLTPIAVLACAAFAVVAGYTTAMIVGTIVAGAGAVLAATAGTVLIPIAMELRYGALTFVEVARQLAIVAGIALLVAVSATLGWFFVVYFASGALMLALAAALADRRYVVAPAVNWAEWVAILREAGPMALFVAVNVFYLKLLIILASLLTSGEELGLFATASRVTEVLVGLPIFMVGVAFPLLAHAGAHDEDRLAYAMQRIGEVTLVVAVFFAVVIVVAADPIIQVFGGSAYDAAIPVLRIQAFALIGASLTQAWIQGVVAVQGQRLLIAVNLVAVVSVAVLGVALIPPFGAKGASLAAVIGETILAAAMLVALVKARRALRPKLGYVPKVLLAGAVATAAMLLPVPAVVQSVIAAVVFFAAAWVLRAIPVEVLRAFLHRDPIP